MSTTSRLGRKVRREAILFATRIIGHAVGYTAGRTWAGLSFGARHTAGSVRQAAGGHAPAGWRKLIPLIGIVVAGLLLHPLLTVMAVAAAAAVFGARGHLAEPEQETSWWSERRLIEALTVVGVLTRPKEGQPGPVLSYRGPPRTDDAGTSVTVMLPPGMLASEVIAKRERLASVMRVPLARLVITHPEGQAPDAVTFWVGTATAAGNVAAPISTAAHTRWADPLRLGLDARGRSVNVQTVGVHTALAGATGFGKTTAARLIAAHALLDRTARVFIIDGKADAADWSDAEPSCSGFVGRINDDTPAKVAAIFAEVLGIVRDRAQRSAGRGRAPWPGVLLIVEEWAAVRSHAAVVLDRKGVEALDRQLSTLLATARSSGVHVVLLAQRLTADNLPATQKANVVQRVVFHCTTGPDYAAALGSEPTERPTRKGQAVLVNERADQVMVSVDHLTDPDWSTVCRRSIAMRPAQPAPAQPAPAEAREGAGPRNPAPGTTTPPTEESAPYAAPGEPSTAASAAVDPEPAEPIDPLLEAVYAVLADSPPAGVPATELLARLPAHVRPLSAVSLGKMLRQFNAEGAHIESGSIGKQRGWRLTTPVGDPSATRRQPVGDPSADGLRGRSHAQTGGPGPHPSDPSGPAGAAW